MVDGSLAAELQGNMETVETARLKRIASAVAQLTAECIEELTARAVKKSTSPDAKHNPRATVERYGGPWCIDNDVLSQAMDGVQEHFDAEGLVTERVVIPGQTLEGRDTNGNVISRVRGVTLHSVTVDWAPPSSVAA